MEPLEGGHEAVHTLPCGHSYHVQCVSRWLRKNATCAVCRDNPFDVGDCVVHDDHGPGKVMSLANGKIWVKYDNGALRRYQHPRTPHKLRLAAIAAPQLQQRD